MTDIVLPLVAAAALVLSALAITLVLGLTLRIQGLERQVGSSPTLADPTRPVGTAISIADLPELPTGTSLAQLEEASFWFFVAASCQPCGELIRNLNARRNHGVPVVMVVPSSEDERLLKLDARFTADWLVDDGGGVRNRFGVRATPVGLIVRNGTIADTELGSGADRLVEVPYSGTPA